MNSAYDLDALRTLGINPGRLGCVMLDTKPLDLDGVLDPDWLYTSEHPDRKWVSGLQTEQHITLLYGLLENAHVWEHHVNEVLDGWEPGHLAVRAVDQFLSPFEAEPYACIIGRLDDPTLRDAHARLSMLPHINTFPTYQAHVTLAYVHQENAPAALNRLGALLPAVLRPVGINLGDEPDPK